MLPINLNFVIILLLMYELVSYVSRGSIRRRVLAHVNSPYTPTQLAGMIKTHRSTISRAILELEKKGLVECITPREHMGRFYRRTELGTKVLSLLRKNEEDYGKASKR